MTKNEYKKAHAVCPECKSNKYACTTMGSITSTENNYIDPNTASCPCGWSGKIDELVENNSLKEKKE